MERIDVNSRYTLIWKGIGQRIFAINRITNCTNPTTHHEIISTFSCTLTSQQGTSTNYTFNNGSNSWQNRHDTYNSSWNNQNTGESSQSARDSFSSQASASVRAGTDVNHQRFLTVRYTNNQSTTNSRGDGSSSSPNGSNTWHQRQNNRYHYELNGTSAAGTGERTTYIWSAMWGTQTDSRGKTTNWGNADPKPMVDKTEDFSWPNATATTTWQQLKEDFQRDPYAGSVFQIGFGVIDVIAGAAMTLGTCGGAVVPGLGLIVVGVDQIAAGINNVQNPGSPSMSVIEYGSYSAAKGLGASENTAQTIGAFTPAALSAIFNVWSSLTACFAAGTPLLTPDGEKPIE